MQPGPGRLRRHHLPPLAARERGTEDPLIDECSPFQIDTDQERSMRFIAYDAAATVPRTTLPVDDVVSRMTQALRVGGAARNRTN